MAKQKPKGKTTEELPILEQELIDLPVPAAPPAQEQVPAGPPPADAALPMTTGLLNEQLITLVERQSELWRRLVRAVVATTGNSDWIEFDGKPYLTVGGAMAIVARAGISLTAKKIEWQSEGDDLICRYYVEARLPIEGRPPIEEVGIASTRDPMLRSRRQDMIEKEGLTVARANRLMADFVQKKAWANAIVRAVTGLLGIRNLTKDELQKMGITPSQASVKFRKRADRRRPTTAARHGRADRRHYSRHHRKAEQGRQLPGGETARRRGRARGNLLGHAARGCRGRGLGGVPGEGERVGRPPHTSRP